MVTKKFLCEKHLVKDDGGDYFKLIVSEFTDDNGLEVYDITHHDSEEEADAWLKQTWAISTPPRVGEKTTFYNLQEFKNAADGLYGNPIYRLSLGSRELFHSNFLAWFFECNSNAVEAIFEISIANPQVLREKHDIDLIITDAKHNTIIAVENKIKDTPKKDQLVEYSKILAKEETKSGLHIKKVLLSLTPHKFELDGWIYLSYDELAILLEKYINTSTVEDDSKIPMVRIYLDMIKQLSLVTKFVHCHDKKSRDFWFSRSNENDVKSISEVKSIDEILEKIKFSDTMQKYRASDLQDRIESESKKSSLAHVKRANKYSKSTEPENIVFVTEHGLTNKTPFVGAWLAVGAKHSELSLGVQIQGTQYRRYISWKKFHVKENEETKNHARLEKFINETDKNEWLFGTDHDENGIMVQNGFSSSQNRFKTSLNSKHSYCSYAPNFIYRYLNISHFANHADLQAENLPKSVIADLEYALKLLDETDYTERFK